MHSILCPIYIVVLVVFVTVSARYHFYSYESKPMAQKITSKIYRTCTEKRSVTSEVAKDPSKSPGHYAKQLYGEQPSSITKSLQHHYRRQATDEDLKRAFECGNWGETKPSELFLRCYFDALCSLEHDPLAGMVSPSLMGSTGLIPLTIIAPVTDVCRHMSNLIARAEKEVFLATNFWMASESSRLITDSLIELSRRAERRGRRVVVKLMYDRGSLRQICDNHLLMKEREYTTTAVNLPADREIPYIDLEVQNYHRPVLGTFHAKFMMVDRRIAIVQSNNIQDNDNLEMMTHLEGPIVDSIYDTALLSWEREMNPPFPCLNDPASEDCHTTFDPTSFWELFDEKGKLKAQSARHEAENAKKEGQHLPLHAGGEPHYDPDIAHEIRRMQSALAPEDRASHMSAVTRHLSKLMPVIKRELHSKAVDSSTKQSYPGHAPECLPEDSFTPMISHSLRQPFPVALVNRRPWGALNHLSVHMPQNEAWLSAIRNATSSIFIQTPDLNAAPLIPALESAIRRGIEVTYYVCLGYNDAGELLPFQGGTNEMVASKLYESLEPEHRKRLHVHYYVAKDQVKPIHNVFKARSCHVKVMIVDGHLGIMGNGNQDTQSWYHSMEVNIMIDSREVCQDWLEGLRRNQNTHLYGAASQEDGIWRDVEGNEPEGSFGTDPGHFGWARGIMSAVQRVRSAGGF